MSSRDPFINSLESVINEVAFTTEKDDKAPEVVGWEAFIADNPQYVQYYRYTAIKAAHLGREALEGQNINKQKLAGAIIRAHLTDEEITHYGREEISA
jgi:hypothetical protein